MRTHGLCSLCDEVTQLIGPGIISPHHSTTTGMLCRGSWQRRYTQIGA